MQHTDDCDSHGDTIRYRCQHYQQGRKDGYTAALRHAVEAVKTAPTWEDWDEPSLSYETAVTVKNAVAAIESLGSWWRNHDPLCSETECQCDLIRAVRKDHRARIVKTLRNLADHMTNGGLDDKTKEAWVLHWVSDLLSVEK